MHIYAPLILIQRFMMNNYTRYSEGCQLSNCDDYRREQNEKGLIGLFF